MATNLFRKAGTLRKTKTDKTDAKVIATMLFSDNSKSYSTVAFAGMEPSTYKFVKFNFFITPMVKHGSTYLRWAI